MAFEKITDTSLANKGVTGLPDVPGLSTAEMQAKFDELSRDVIIPKLNEIVDGLNGDEVGLSSKIENPETKEKDVIQNVVNAIYQIVKENSDKRHGHENKETLDKVTAELYDSINALVSMFNGISAVDKTVTADDTKIPTSGAIVNYVTELGAGDMQKAVYDKNNTGIVDDAEKLGGVAPEEYLQKASLPDTTVAFEVAETRSNISTGEKVSTVFGKIKKFFADLTAPAFAQMITTKEDLLATKVTGYVPDAKAVADGFADVNGKLIVPDYANAKLLDNTLQTNSFDFTAPQNGILLAGGYGSNQNNSYIIFRYSANRSIQFEIQGSSYEFIGALFPVAKGDVIEIITSLATKNNGTYFIPSK